jgi:uncharacterized membrane protein
MLIVFPLGLLVTAVVFDLVYLINNDAVFAQVAFWNTTAGIAGAIVAAVPGLLDWLAIPAGTRAKRIGRWHGIGNVVVLVLFVVVWLYRRGEENHAVGTAWFILELVAIAIGSVTSWLGGELVDRLGIGIHPQAGVDAPSSLSRPGRAQA